MGKEKRKRKTNANANKLKIRKIYTEHEKNKKNEKIMLI